MSAPHPTPQVALLIETSRGYGRQIATGVARYARLHGPWSFYINPGDFEQFLPELRYWRGDGVFARLDSPKLRAGLVSAKLPTIALEMTEQQLASKSPTSRFTDLRVDGVAAANLAAEHLLERMYAYYAFVGIAGKVWSQRREVAFLARIKKAGFAAQTFVPLGPPAKQSWEHERPALAEWLAGLPKPVGIMACNDERGLQVLDACRLANINVPKEIAVVGVDNDELLCELANPALSSVALNAVMGGYRAAAHLDHLMRGKTPRTRVLNVEALRVVQRTSTDTVASDDRAIATALEFIQRTKGRGIKVEDVARHAKLSRRELDARFGAGVGRTVLTEIQRVRLEHAKRLLEETDYPIPHVAEHAGYSSASYMVQVFRNRLDMTPAKYRASVRMLSVGGEAGL